MGTGPQRTHLHLLPCDEAGREISAPVPVGRPIANTTVWVLDERQRLQPVGIPGELYTGGDGLAEGYVAQPELTAERFVEVIGLGRLYRTGDICRWRTDGVVEFLGRRDNQVKLRGYRIEPGEIEAALRALPEIEDAAVQVQGEDELRRLVAWVTRRDTVANEEGIREALRHRLPSYLIPAQFVVLDELPVTSNGKIHYAQLPEPAISREAPPSNSPALFTASEELLAGIWVEALGVEPVSPEDNFFDCGGNSILAMRLVARIAGTFGREVPVERIFTAPTLRQLAGEIDRTDNPVSCGRIERLAGDQLIPLSFAQERLWFLHQLESNNPFYNTPVGLRVHGFLDEQALEGAMQDLAGRHEVLRTAFVQETGQPRQLALAHVPVNLSCEDWAQLEEAERERALVSRAREEARKPFASLAEPPLFRAVLIRLGPEDHALLLTMHHIVTDGWSLNILNRELAHFYNARLRGEPARLNPLPIQYGDFAAWQRHRLQGETLRKLLDYWRESLAGAPPMLALPTDHPRPAVQEFRGGSIRFETDRNTRDALLRCGREHGSTLFMTLLSAFAVLLYRYSGQSDLVIGSPVANRQRPELEGLLGFFVNTLALRIPLAGTPMFSELLARVRRLTLDAYAHQDLPFEKLVDEIQPERDLSRSPLFQVMMALQNAPFERVESDGLRFSPIRIQREAALFDLVLDLWDTEDGLVGVLEYNKDLFEASTAERMSLHFGNLLEAFAENPRLGIDAAPLMKAAERARLLEWSNGPGVRYPVDRSYAACFEEQVEKTPHALAAVAQGRSITYSALNRRANRIAWLLRERGLTPNVPAGVLIPRGLDYLAAVLGIIKAGGTFVPLDASYPPGRIRYMLEDCGCALLLSNAEGMASLPDEAENVEQVVLVSDCPQDAQGHGHLRTSCEWTQPETSDLESASRQHRKRHSVSSAHIRIDRPSQGCEGPSRWCAEPYVR